MRMARSATAVSVLSIVALMVPVGAASARTHEVAARRPITWVQIGPDNSGYTRSVLNRLGQVAFGIGIGDLIGQAALWDRGATTEIVPFVSEATAINDRGTVAGYTFPHHPAFGSAQGFIWRDGVLRSVGVAGEQSVPVDVNERDEVLVNRLPAGAPSDRASVLRHGREIVSPLVLDGQPLRGGSMNDRGQVVGTSADHRGTFLWQPGTEPRRLEGLSSTWFEAQEINDAGTVVGEYAGNDNIRTFVWRRGRMVDIGTLGGSATRASPTDIENGRLNERGQVTGESELADATAHAFLWTDGHMIDLGTLGGRYSSGVSVNDRGEVVGLSETAAGNLSAFLWRDGTMIDLGALVPGAQESRAHQINNRGQVLGRAFKPWDDLILWETRNRG
jgi:probable HAF family extracellular repeat protein